MPFSDDLLIAERKSAKSGIGACGARRGETAERKCLEVAALSRDAVGTTKTVSPCNAGTQGTAPARDAVATRQGLEAYGSGRPTGGSKRQGGHASMTAARMATAMLSTDWNHRPHRYPQTQDQGAQAKRGIAPMITPTSVLATKPGAPTLSGRDPM